MRRQRNIGSLLGNTSTTSSCPFCMMGLFPASAQQQQARRRDRREILVIHRPEPSTTMKINRYNRSDAFLRGSRMMLQSPAVSLCPASDYLRCAPKMTDLADISLISLKHRRTCAAPTYPRDPGHERTLFDTAFCRTTEWHQTLRFR
jgi:hypothetical protein